MMVLVGIGLSIIGVEFAVIIAILTGIGNLIPYVGPFIAYGGVILSSLIAGNMKTFIIAMIFLLIIQTVTIQQIFLVRQLYKGPSELEILLWYFLTQIVF